MSERKVLNKYIPPDFDPSQLKRVKNRDKTGPKQQTVRLMTPFSMRCNNCGEYIYKGKKFNARKEDTLEQYYSVKIYRFHIKCTRCSSGITFRTDPKNADYAAESGAQRNFEPWRTEPAAEDDDETELDKLEKEESAMEQLESKTMDAKKEMEIDDMLDEIRMRNAQHQRVGVDSLIAKLERDREMEEIKAREATVDRAEEEDRQRAKAVFSGDNGSIVRRLRDDGPVDNAVPATATTSNPPAKVETPKFVPQIAKKRERGSLLGVKVAKKVKLV